jgi:hypothetical protein
MGSLTVIDDSYGRSIEVRSNLNNELRMSFLLLLVASLWNSLERFGNHCDSQTHQTRTFNSQHHKKILAMTPKELESLEVDSSTTADERSIYSSTTDSRQQQHTSNIDYNGRR